MPNVLDQLFPKILAQALVTLREACVLPNLVNKDFSAEAAMKGDVIHVPIPSKMSTVDVVPSAVAQEATDLNLQTVQIPMSTWKEVNFQLTDRDVLQVMDGVVSMQVTEAARAIANSVNSSILSLYKNTPYFVGTPGTTPFATDLSAAAQARKVLNGNNCPTNDRRLVLDGDAEANAVILPALASYMNSAETGILREGQIGRKLGFDWFYDQQMMEIFHAAGTLSGATTSAAPVVGQRIEGVTNGTVTATAANGQTVKQGDVFTVAGDKQTYVVTQNATSTGSITIQFSPAPAVTWANGSAISLRASHNNNLAFHRDAIALAIRPLKDDVFGQESGQIAYMTMTDPVSGIPLRVEYKRENKRSRFSLDILWGCKLIRPELLVRVLG